MKFVFPLFFFALVTLSIAEVPVIIETGGRKIPDFEKQLANQIEYVSSRIGIETINIDTIRIVITYTRNEFNRATQNAVPDWGIGAALPSKNKIILLFTEGSKSPESIELVGHELGHIILHNSVGEVWLPRWFDEGFAQWVSGNMDFSQSSRLALANLFGEEIRLWELETVNSWTQDKANLAYAESRAAFDFLLDLLPEKHPEPLIREIRKQQDFEEGFKLTTGFPLREFYFLWSRERGNRFGWSLLLADWRVLFSIITFLFLILGTVELLRRRASRKKAELESEYEKVTPHN